MRLIKAFTLSLALSVVAAATSANAQDGDAPLVLDGGPSESSGRIEYSAAELIQLRALEAQRQRRARIEARNWAGYDPARPVVAANPYSQSRYRVYVPHGFIWPAWSAVYVY